MVASPSPVGASPVLHARSLAGCEHRVALDFAHPETDSGRSDTPEAMRRIEAAQAQRARVRDVLRSVHSDQPGAFVEVDDTAPHRERVARTRQACVDGTNWIWNATLPTDFERGRRGHAELLVRVDDGYLPVIVVNHRVTYPAKRPQPGAAEPPKLLTSPLWTWAPIPDPFRTSRSQRRDLLRLAHLTQMLLDLGLAPTGGSGEADLSGGVIGLDADCIVVHRVGEILDDYREVFARRQAIARGAVQTTPRKVGECRACPWWPSCGPTLERRHDISLVAGGNQASALATVGVHTIDDLAAYRGDPPEGWPANVGFDDAVVGAIAWLDDLPLVRRVTSVQVHRADVEVDVDMESYGEDGAYLWGTLLTDRADVDRAVRYRGFVTWDPLPTRDEARSFAEFWRWLMTQRDAARADAKTFAAYCYSEQAENRWLRDSADRFAGEPGIPTRDEIDAFIASDEWVDIYAAVRRTFVSPRGKGLKRVAPVAGFAWRDAQASGEASMDWYRLAVGLDGLPVDESQRSRLLEYNEDDVWATKVLREWMDTVADTEVPFAGDLLAARASPAESRSGAGEPGADSGAGGAQCVEEGTAAEQCDGPEQHQ